MLETFKRLFARAGVARNLDDVSAWAKAHGHGFKRARGDDGFVIDGSLGGKPWRLEWGPPQRSYIEGHELRLRMELGLSPDTQMLLLSRPLMDALERKTFEEFTDNVQTQIGTQSPEEMRWLVMFPKVNMSSLKPLRARFGAVASTPTAGLSWLEGPVAELLEQASRTLLRDDPPFVLMTLRGRAYLRLQMAAPEVNDLAAAVELFEAAARQSLRVGVVHSDTRPDWNTSATTAWQSLQPDDAGDPRQSR